LRPMDASKCVGSLPWSTILLGGFWPILGMGRRWKGLVVKGAERKRKEDEREKGAGGGMGFRGSFLSLVLGGIDSHVIAIY